jgi:hypothetical protein
MRSIDRCDPSEGFLSIDRPQPLTPTASHNGRQGIFPILSFLRSISMPCWAANFDGGARLHIGNKLDLRYLASHVSLFCDCQSIIHFDVEISNGAFDRREVSFWSRLETSNIHFEG